jgi:hypothetical protein
MLDSLLTKSREIILANMRLSASLTLEILKSLYPRADLDTAGEGFVVTCSDEESLKLVEDSVVMAGQVIDMLRVDVPRVDCDMIILSTLETFLHVVIPS